MSGAQPGAPPVWILLVGSELLEGRVEDRNGPAVAEAVSGRGGRVTELRIVGDEASAIGDALAEAAERGESVVLAGGLGPTPDDRTREAVAAHAGRELVPSREWIRVLREEGRRIEITGEAGRRQALLPRDSRLLPNPVGTAAGFALSLGGRWILALPGVPAELRAILRGEGGKFLDERLPGRRPLRRRVRTAGVAESRLAERIEGLPELRELEVGSYPLGGCVDLVLTLPPSGSGGDATGEGPGEDRLDRAVEALRRRLGEDVYEVGERSLAAVVLDGLARAGESLAVAESCTGGLLGGEITSVPGSSRVFWGGAVSYADEAKERVLGLSRRTLERSGAVSEECAREMAAGVRARAGTTWGVAVTGIAGPGGGTDEKPVGTVWTAVDGPTPGARRDLHPGDRREVRERSVTVALDALRRAALRGE